MKRTNWKTEKNSILNCSYITLAMILALSLIVLITFTFVVYFPIRRIIHGADEYAAGNLNYKIPVESNDEIGYLAASMNYMAGELNNSGESSENLFPTFRMISVLRLLPSRYVEAMLDGTIPPEMQERYLNVVLSETNRLTKLTKGLLTLNNFDDKERTWNLQISTSMRSFAQTVETFRSLCWDKHISFQLTFEEESLYVNADIGKIQQVLYNLIDNAVKFSHPDSLIYISSTGKTR